ncbi:MAG: thiamine diphosphokinase [Ruminococcaceae bacterium]|nr:thiamine diphosphokinase [Oscillospiraceae bacterium]
MRAYIFVGGSVNADNIFVRPEKDELSIAADQGYATAKALGARVDLFVGDMDSFDGEIEDGIEIIKLKPEKDVTDTEAAFELAIGRGAREILIIGGLDGRLDHTLANIYLLEDAKGRGVTASIEDGRNRVRFIRNDSALVVRSGYRYFGLLAVDEVVRGVEIDGAKYKLKNAKLTRKNAGFAVSNEITGNCAFINVKKGGVFIVESEYKKG